MDGRVMREGFWGGGMCVKRYPEKEEGSLQYRKDWLDFLPGGG